MLSLRTCLRLTIGILVAFAGLAITAYADETSATVSAGPAIAEKPIRLTQDAEPTISQSENVLIGDALVEAIATDVELIWSTKSIPEPTIPQGPAVAEKPTVIVVVEEPVITGPAVAEKPIQVKEIKEIEVVELAEVAEIAEVEVLEVEVVEQIEVEILTAPVVEEAVQTVVVRGPAIAEKPVRVELAEEIVVESNPIPVGPAVAEAGPHRTTTVAVVSETELEPQRDIELNDWVSLVAPQISPPAWLVCQWIFAK